MSHERSTFRVLGRRFTTAGLAAAAALLLSSGLVWSVRAADTPREAAPAPVAAAQAAPAVGGSAARRDSYADIVAEAAPAVVTIRTEGRANTTTRFAVPDSDLFRRFFGDRFGDQLPEQPRTFRQQGLGSGVVVGEDGYILTNHHVIRGASTINVELTDGRSWSAELVGSDEPSDLALLKIDAENLRVLRLADSDAVHVGDVVLAVGNPLGIGQTVTMGIISAKGRTTTGPGEGAYEDFLQTDAPINHGNSGGALVNLRGELVGINSQILSPSDGNIGIGFAIPSNMARHVMDQLRTSGRVTRAQLGVTVQTVTADLAKSIGLSGVRGAIVTAVTPGSAADRAGLVRGDVIQTFNGEPIHDTNALRNRVSVAGPGKDARLTFIRDGREQQVTVALDEASPARLARQGGESGRSGDPTALGLSVAPLTPDLARRLDAPRDARGLVVQDVDPAGRAAEAGIQAGDIIEEVNRQPVQSADELRTAVNETTDRPLLLLVSRNGNSLFLTVPQEG